MTGAPYRCLVARTLQAIADAQRVRLQVYGEEERLLPPEAARDGREIDARDEDGDTVHLLVYAGDEPAGTIRLLPARTGDSETLGLDLESKLALTVSPAGPVVVAGEVTRYCVLRRYRHTPVARLLYLALAHESRLRGITHWFAVANLQTRSAAEAARIYALLQARHLVDPRFRAEARAGLLPFAEGPNAGDRAVIGAALALPPIIALFTGKMGARCIGAPVHDPTFDVFAVPIVAEVPPAVTGAAGATLLGESPSPAASGPTPA